MIELWQIPPDDTDEEGETMQHAYQPPPAADPEDDTDAQAYPKARRLVCSVSTDGRVCMAHRHGSGIVLTREEARELYQFLGDTARAWMGGQ